MSADSEKELSTSQESREIAFFAQKWSRDELGLSSDDTSELANRRFLERLEENEFFSNYSIVAAHQLLTAGANGEKPLPTAYRMSLRGPAKTWVDEFTKGLFDREPAERQKVWQQLREATSFAPEEQQRLLDLWPALSLDVAASLQTESKFRPWLLAMKRLATTPRLQRPAVRQRLLQELAITNSDASRLITEFEQTHPGWKEIDPLFFDLIAGKTQEYTPEKPTVSPTKSVPKEKTFPISFLQGVGFLCFVVIAVLRMMNIGTKVNRVITPRYSSVPQSSPSPERRATPNKGIAFVSCEYRERKSDGAGWGEWNRCLSLIDVESKAYRLLTTDSECDLDQLRFAIPFLEKKNNAKCKISQISKEGKMSGGARKLDVFVEFDEGEILIHLIP